MKPLGPHDYRCVGPFQILGILGHGGQGNVYLGQRTSDGRLAAVKILRFDDGAEAVRRRLRREITNAQRVPQHWTARIIDWDVDGETPFVATEYIQGQTLQELVAARGPLPPERVYRLAVQTIDALEVIHDHGVVHRDFKPGNVMSGPDGWVVIDFGVARVIGATQATQARGTLSFMAPEQFHGRDEYATDLFAWAATLVFAATGRLPFEGPTEQATIHAILYDPPELHGLGGPTGEIVSRCLDKDPSQRPTIAEVRAWLRTRQRTEATTAPVAVFGSAGTTAPMPEPVTRIRPRLDTPPSPPPPPSTPVWRRPAVYAVAGVLCLALLAGALWAGVTILRPGGAEPSAAPSMPAESMPVDLRAFAPNWPHGSFTPAPLRPHQAEKWGLRSGDVSVSIVRYDGRAAFDKERENVRNYQHGSRRSADWKQGTGTNAIGHRGPYIEYEVPYSPQDGGGIHVCIWWDDSETHPNNVTALILQTTATDDPQQALDHLRQVWRSHHYSGP